jgi:hypothetical protein
MTATIDVTGERTIAASPEAVATIMFDPRQDPSWPAARLSG